MTAKSKRAIGDLVGETVKARRPRPGVTAMIRLDDLRVDPAVQQRVGLRTETVAEYADLLRDGVALPPIIVFENPHDPGEGAWLADGFHRVAGARAAGLEEILCLLKRGTRRDAILYSVGCNADHGLPRTRADKRRAVETLLRDPEWSGWSDRAIAEAARVSHTFVANVRADLAGGNVATRPPTNAENSTASPTDDSAAGRSAPAEVTSTSDRAPAERPAGEQREPDPQRIRSHPEGGYLPTRELINARGDKLPADVLARPKCPRSGRPLGACDCDLCIPEATAAELALPLDEHERRRKQVVAEAARRQLERALAVGDTVHPIADADAPPAPVVEQVNRELALEGDAELEVGELPNDERAPFDAYWTPLATARACVRWLREVVLDPLAKGKPPRTWDLQSAVEPAVGGGAWIDAVHDLLTGWKIDRVDIDPDAPGLDLERRDTEDRIVQDWLTPLEHGRRLWQLVIGNRPYSDDELSTNENLDRWIEVSLERARVVALLERETITGTLPRLGWWREHRPAWICKVVPRPKWQGPGARKTSDFGDSVLIVWIRDHKGPTCWDWIDAEYERLLDPKLRTGGTP